MPAFVLSVMPVIHVGLNKVSAFSAVATCVNNRGPGLRTAAYNF